MSKLISQKDIIDCIYLNCLLPLNDDGNYTQKYNFAFNKLISYRYDKWRLIQDELVKFSKKYLIVDKISPILCKESNKWKKKWLK